MMDFDEALGLFAEKSPRLTEVILELGEKRSRMSSEDDAEIALDPLNKEYEQLANELAEIEEPFLDNFAGIIMGQMLAGFNEFDKKRDAFLRKHPFPGGKKYEKALTELLRLYTEKIEEFQILRLVSLNPFCERHGLDADTELKNFLDARNEDQKFEDRFYLQLD